MFDERQNLYTNNNFCYLKIMFLFSLQRRNDTRSMLHVCIYYYFVKIYQLYIHKQEKNPRCVHMWLLVYLSCLCSDNDLDAIGYSCTIAFFLCLVIYRQTSSYSIQVRMQFNKIKKMINCYYYCYVVNTFMFKRIQQKLHRK